MCGRYTQTSNAELLRERFQFREAKMTLVPRFNLAPSQTAPVLIAEPGVVLAGMRWGLVPAWAKDPAIGNKLINARSETAPDKPSFARCFMERRCLVPADGFYEWKRGSGAKIPFRFVRKDRQPFAFAGLWDSWTGPGGAALETFTILTTEAAPLIKPVHSRMPVILAPESEDLWLDPGAEKETLCDLLVPYERGDMEAYRVSLRVNSPANDDELCIEPAEDTQRELF